MKDQMDRKTVVFSSKYHSKGFSLKYLNENFKDISKELSEIDNIYYKANQNRNSWIDYKHALLPETNTDPTGRILSYSERIINGLMKGYKHEGGSKLSPSLDELYETNFIDIAGHMHLIGKRDGLAGSSGEFKLLYNNNEFDLTFKEDDFYKWVEIGFMTNIEDSLITLNGLFFPYELVNSFKIRYYLHDSKKKDKTLLPKLYSDLLEEYRIVRKGLEDVLHLKVYKWKDMIIELDNPIHARDYKHGWFIFDEYIDEETETKLEINDSYLLFYNRVLHFFDVHPSEKNMIKILGEKGHISNYKVGSGPHKLDGVFLIKLAAKFSNTVEEDDKEMRQDVIQERFMGFIETDTNIAHFPRDISNAFITYNGAYQDHYVLPNKHSIKFKYRNSLLKQPSEASSVSAIVFYNEDSYLKSTTHTMTQDISVSLNLLLQKYKIERDILAIKLHDLRKSHSTYEIIDDYKDTVLVTDRNTVKLKYFPENIENTLRFYINGVLYTSGRYFDYNETTNELNWTYSETVGGFDLDNTMSIIAIYDININDSRNSGEFEELKEILEANKKE